MLQNLTLLEMASALARHSSARHAVIAENIAHADTPGYRARDVAEFTTAVNETLTEAGFRQTREGHLAPDGTPLGDGPRIVEMASPPKPNGNSVSLEEQIQMSVLTQGRHRLAMTVYDKVLDILRVGLGPNR